MKHNQFIFLLSICFIFLQGHSLAQNKFLKIDDPFTNAEVYPDYLDNLTWAGNNSSFSWIDGDNLVSGNVKNDKTEPLLSLTSLNNLITSAGKSQIKYFPSVTWINSTSFYFTSKNNIFRYNTGNKKLEIVTEYDKNAQNTDIEPHTLRVAYTTGNNLFISEKNNSIQITHDTASGIVNGKSVHRDEFGIEKGTFWSPSGNQLAFYHMDESMVTRYPLVNIEPVPAELHDIRYPMAGMKSHHVTVGVYNINTGKTIFLKTGEPAEQYLTNITWSPDEKFIYIAVLNRAQNHMKLNKYNAVSGNFEVTLFEETNDKYVEPLHPLYFLNNNNDEFVWLSRRDGFMHAYLYNINGKLTGQLTKGNWEIESWLGFDKKNTTAFFTANKNNMIGKDIYSVKLKSKELKRLSVADGYHEAIFSPDFQYVIDQYSNSKDVVNRYDLISAEGKLVRTLLNSRNPLKNYAMGETSIFTLKADDGTDLYCRMIKPANMESGKRYPVFFYVYGGPHSQLVTDEWLGGAGLFQNYMAQQGYVVFTMDNRGTARRGAAFEQAVFRNLGTVEMADQMKGIEFLKKQNFVDTSRMGIHGWSFGGFMTLTMTLRNPGLFKVSIAGGPVTDWKYYEVMYGERYMDTPQENPEGYEKSKLINYVNNLTGKLLLIHGTADSTVVWQNSLTILQKFIEEGKLVDYFVYPGQEHNMRGKAAIHLYRKIEQYFKDNL